jgi:replication fork protection complex subunit Tof1/Swi1
MDIVEDGAAPEKEGPIAIPDDDEDEDDAPVSKKPPARRLRAGFLDDSDSDE